MNILADISLAIRKPQLWLELGIQDFFDQYSRAYLGVVWAVLQPALWVVAITLFFGPLMGGESDVYTAYIAIGITVYNFITSALTEGGNAFTRRGGLIQNFPLPLFSYILRDTVKVTVRLGAQSLVVVAVFFYYGIGLTLDVWKLIPAFAVLTLTCVSTSLLVSIATAWSGDLQHAISSVMRLIFFATPIIWMLPDEPGLRNTLAQANPFTHFIEIVRAPLLGYEITTFSQVYVAVCTILSILLSLIVGRLFGNRVAFWVIT